MAGKRPCKKKTEDLKVLRDKIDRLDLEIVRILNQRAAIAVEIGRIKKGCGMQIYAPQRERQVYDKIASHNKGPLNNTCIKAIYRELMSGSLALENPISISYLGPPGTFAHMAAINKFGSCVEYVPVKDIDAIFTEVITGNTDYGVVPIETATGAIGDTLDMFIEHDVRICSELLLCVHHNLLSNSPRKAIRRIYSKTEALKQCRKWITSNTQDVELIEVDSTTRAAKKAAKEEGSALIASEIAAKIYGLKIVCASIEDSMYNVTRFLVIGGSMNPRSGKDKTSVMVSVRHESGALVRTLIPFQKAGINLTWIECRPSRVKAWEYYFFIDFEGHNEDENVKEVLKKIESSSIRLKILGSFPIADKPF